MEYKTLEKIYYSSPNDYEKIYLERYNGDYTHRLHFDIGGNKAFFIVTPDIQKKMLGIQRMDKTVSRLCAQLPGKAIEQFTKRCLIDELVLTNSIEGVSSTRREMYDVLEGMGRGEAKKRFTGLTQKYIMLQRGEGIRLETCEDIRKIYDELVLPEVTEEDPKNAPDGVLFRKDSVSVCSGTQKEIHRGLYPERKIISAMESALEYLNDESEELLLRTAVFHYLLGYIHPFYDGNGRLNRFISSCMMAKELEPVSGYRLSYTIKENLGDYNNAFKVCNRPQNKGVCRDVHIGHRKIDVRAARRARKALGAFDALFAEYRVAARCRQRDHIRALQRAYSGAAVFRKRCFNGRAVRTLEQERRDRAQKACRCEKLRAIDNQNRQARKILRHRP